MPYFLGVMGPRPCTVSEILYICLVEWNKTRLCTKFEADPTARYLYIWCFYGRYIMLHCNLDVTLNGWWEFLAMRSNYPLNLSFCCNPILSYEVYNVAAIGSTSYGPKCTCNIMSPTHPLIRGSHCPYFWNSALVLSLSQSITKFGKFWPSKAQNKWKLLIAWFGL